MASVSCFADPVTMQEPALTRSESERAQPSPPVASTLSEYQAICDMHTKFKDSLFPWRRKYLFQELDRVYRHAKFIFTYRDIDSWLLSRKMHVLRNQSNSRYKGGFVRVQKAKWRRLWKHYHATALEHFQDRPDDILFMNIIKGDGWDRLCPFLGLPTPNVPFPRLNVSVRPPRAVRGRLRTHRRRAR